MYRRIVLVMMASVVLLVLGTASLAQETPTPPPPPAPTPAPAPAQAAPPPAAAPAAPVVKAVKIVVDNKAKSAGEIHFVFTPSGGTARDIRVTVAKGMGKGEICRDIAKELTVAVGDGFKVDHYDDDKVEVEGKKDATFSLVLAGQTVTGITIGLK